MKRQVRSFVSIRFFSRSLIKEVKEDGALLNEQNIKNKAHGLKYNYLKPAGRSPTHNLHLTERK